MTWPLAGGLTRDVAWDLGDSVLNMWILAWDCEQLRGILQWPLLAPPALLRREHLSSRAADARVFGASRSSGAPDLSDLRADEESDPLLQPAVSLDVRAVGSRHVPVRARADRQHRGGVRWRTALRVRAVPDSAVVAPAGAVVAVDAVCAVRIQALLRRRTDAARSPAPPPPSSSRDCRAVTTCCTSRRSRRLRAVGDVARGSLARPADVARPCGRSGGCRGRDRAVRRSVHARQPGAAVIALADGNDAAFGGRLFVRAPRRWPSASGDSDSPTYFRNPRASCFQGWSPFCLALIGIAVERPRPRLAPRASASARSRGRRAVAVGIAVAHAIAAAATIVFRRLTLDLWLFDVRLGNVTQLLLRAAIAYAIAARTVTRDARTRRCIHALARILRRSRSWPRRGCRSARRRRCSDDRSISRRRTDSCGTYVPGFEGLRVPARFAMIVGLMLAVLGAYGAAAIAAPATALDRCRADRGCFSLRGWRDPFIVNGMSPVARVQHAGRAARIHRDRAPADLQGRRASSRRMP